MGSARALHIVLPVVIVHVAVIAALAEPAEFAVEALLEKDRFPVISQKKARLKNIELQNHINLKKHAFITLIEAQTK
nr:hypothetical protein [uncultured Chryseobacterium sp.]